MQGTCSKGDACAFRHNPNAKHGTQEWCPTWKRTSQCDDPACPHLHPKQMSSPTGAAPVPVPFPPIPWTRRPDCLYFLRGTCTKGDKCVFRHNENAFYGPREVCPTWTATGTCADQACVYVHPKPSTRDPAAHAGDSHPATPTTGFAYSPVTPAAAPSTALLAARCTSAAPYAFVQAPGATQPPAAAPAPAPAAAPAPAPAGVFYHGSPPLAPMPGAQSRHSFSQGTRSRERRADAAFTFQQKRVPSMTDLQSTVPSFFEDYDQASSPTFAPGYLRSMLPQQHQQQQQQQQLPGVTQRRPSYASDIHRESWDAPSSAFLYSASISAPPAPPPPQPSLLGTPSVEPFHLHSPVQFLVGDEPAAAGAGLLAAPLPPLPPQQAPPVVPSPRAAADSAFAWMGPLRGAARLAPAGVRSPSASPDTSASASRVSQPVLGDEAAGEDEDGLTGTSDPLARDAVLASLLPPSLTDDAQSPERSEGDAGSVREDRSVCSSGSARSAHSRRSFDLSLDTSVPVPDPVPTSIDSTGTGTGNGNGTTRLAGHSKLRVSNSGSASASAGSSHADASSSTGEKARDWRGPMHAHTISGTSVDLCSEDSACDSDSDSDSDGDSDSDSECDVGTVVLPDGVEQIDYDTLRFLAPETEPAAPPSTTSSRLVKTATAFFVSPDPRRAGIKAQVLLFSAVPAADEEHVRTELARLCGLGVRAPHPGLVPYLGLCVPPRDPLCLVAAYVPPAAALCSRVAALARAGREMPLAERVSVCTQVAAALQHLHRHGVVHGSLTPAAVHVFSDRTDKHGSALCQLSAYGIEPALALLSSSSGSSDDDDEESEEDEEEEERFLCFQAPEMLLASADATPQSDVYSLGVLMLYMLQRGAVPLARQSRAQLRATVAGGVQARAKTVVAVPPTLRCEYGYARLLTRCCRIDPARRPADMDAVLAQLHTLVT